MNDREQLAAPVAGGVRRILYLRAGHERVDQQHDEVAAKALEAGYGSDSAALTGGGALREQSLQGAPINYFDFRNKLAAAMRRGEVGAKPRVAELVDLARRRFQYSCDQASESVEWFIRDLRSRR